MPGPWEGVLVFFLINVVDAPQGPEQRPGQKEESHQRRKTCLRSVPMTGLFLSFMHGPVIGEEQILLPSPFSGVMSAGVVGVFPSLRSEI